ncbi:MAG: YceD family protein [Gammaproteobacteria bacterium]|nr:YceD family protein [Gammaproteobacteria bacterium]
MYGQCLDALPELPRAGRSRFDARIEAIIVATIDQLIELDEDEDGVVCEGSMLRVVDIVEDELMVSLPMVPRHSDGDCGETWQPESDDETVEEEPETHRPFAGLDALKKDLKRSE